MRSEIIPVETEIKLLRLLLIEDNLADVELLEYELRHAGLDFTLAVVQTPEEFTQELRANSPHLVMADYNLPGWGGLEALEIIAREGLDVPLILVTGELADTTAVDCIKQGASDYVLKGALARLPLAIRRALQEKSARELRKRTEQELELNQISLEQASDAVFWLDPHGHFVYANQTGCRSLGYSREELLSLTISDVDPLVPPEAWETVWQEIKTRQSMSFESQNRTKEGRIFPVEVSANYLKFDGMEYNFSFVRDITERKAAEQEIQFLAYSDALTGLPNRRLLQDRLTKALADARRRGNKVALLFLDLDRFKNINDSLGNSAADLLLKQVGNRLSAFVREQDTIARVGGDEFLIVLTGLKDATEAAVAAERLMGSIVGEYSIHSHTLHLSCSVGISIFPEQGTYADTLIKNAEAAMFSAKETGRNGFQFFTQDLDAQSVERLNLENSLRLALDKEELFLVYQPQMDLTTGKIIGLEALLRWQHPKLGLVPPDKFISIAEKSGLIVPIGEWVLRTACSQAQKWLEDGLPPVRLAVNVSAVQFRRPGFPESVRRLLDETGFAPQNLELELTEGLLLANAAVNLSVIQELNDIGLALAIDDFGTGYSNFGYLKQFRVSKLKIDGSFIRDLNVNPDDAAITVAIISMAKSLRLKVIAECVENEAQMSFLREHRCDEVQGYYFSRPLAADKVADKLRGEDSATHVLAQVYG
jgi:diguanylate cyclase (GGDEF)-like protein/PAS domain S-box-containing protein